MEEAERTSKFVILTRLEFSDSRVGTSYDPAVSSQSVFSDRVAAEKEIIRLKAVRVAESMCCSVGDDLMTSDKESYKMARVDEMKRNSAEYFDDIEKAKSYEDLQTAVRAAMQSVFAGRHPREEEDRRLNFIRWIVARQIISGSTQVEGDAVFKGANDAYEKWNVSEKGAVLERFVLTFIDEINQPLPDG